MKCDMCGEEKLLFEAHTGVCVDCYNRYFNFHLKNNQLEEKVQNLEMSLNEAKDTADAFYKELKVYKRALELACFDVSTVSIITKILKDNQLRATLEDVINYYLDQAKKELEDTQDE